MAPGDLLFKMCFMSINQVRCRGPTLYDLKLILFTLFTILNNKQKQYLSGQRQIKSSCNNRRNIVASFDLLKTSIKKVCADVNIVYANHGNILNISGSIHK